MVLTISQLRKDQPMDLNRIEGAARDLGGKGEEFLGKVTDKPGTQAQGIADQVVGAAQNFYGQAKDRLSDAADRVPDALSQASGYGQQAYKDGSRQLAAQVGKQPIETLLLVGAVGFLLGWATTRGTR